MDDEKEHSIQFGLPQFINLYSTNNSKILVPVNFYFLDFSSSGLPNIALNQASNNQTNIS